MENAIIKSEGFTINGFHFANFFLASGGYLSIDFQESIDFRIEKILYGILSGNIKMKEVSIMMNIISVITPMMKSGPTLFYKKTAFNYLKDESSLTPERIRSLLREINIDPKINIYRLGANERKLLSLEAAYSKSKNIITSTSGLDYNGIERIRNRVGKEIDNGSLIEITYPTSKGREYLFDDLGTRQKRIAVKSVASTLAE